MSKNPFLWQTYRKCTSSDYFAPCTKESTKTFKSLHRFFDPLNSLVKSTMYIHFAICDVASLYIFAPLSEKYHDSRKCFNTRLFNLLNLIKLSFARTEVFQFISFVLI